MGWTITITIRNPRKTSGAGSEEHAPDEGRHEEDESSARATPASRAQRERDQSGANVRTKAAKSGSSGIDVPGIAARKGRLGDDTCVT